MNTQRRKILVTSALPYANGDIHIGHLVEYLQTDFWVRFQKMRGHECLYMCADDTHGTPIMIAATQQHITPEKLIEDAERAHLADFGAFQIRFDNYGSTNCGENRKLSEYIFSEMQKKGHIASRSIKQAFCEHDKVFLPDRFVRGNCPRCNAENQYGDSCDNCSATYSPTEVKNPKCSICGNAPVEKESEHLFFRLEHFHDFLKSWVLDHTQKEIARKLNEWLSDELKDWDISRDKPYFGFEIPGHPGKYFYVWLDAPIGYISSTEQWCKKNSRDLDEFWKREGSEIYHFIGKDIVYFHTLFWPAMLKASGFKTPDQVFVHGFLKVNGEKMSKSKGTFINALTFRKHIDPLYLRYYYACKLSSSVDDVDLNFGDFVSRVNSDLVGKITNVASRGFQMLHSRLEGTLGVLPPDGKALVDRAREKGESIARHFEARDFSKAMVEIREIADDANKYFDDYEPWKLVNQDQEKTRGILTAILNLFRLMSVYLKPILPSYVSAVEGLFHENEFSWDSSRQIVENRTLEPYSHLIKRLDHKQIDKVIEDTKAGTVQPPASPPNDTALIDITDFSRVDLRVAKVLNAEDVPGADKLVKLTLDIGEGKRTVFAGIKGSYKNEELVGRHLVLVANLKPRKMKFGISEGMILACGDGNQIRVLSPDQGAIAGQKIS